MKTSRTGCLTLRAGILCALAAAMLALTGFAAAEGTESAPHEMDLILAQDVVDHGDLRAPDGSPLKIRSDPSMPGRGQADAEGREPDYTGIVGFAVLAKDPEVSAFSVFDKAYWAVPAFRKAGDGFEGNGRIAHKTPVVVIGQELRPDGQGAFTGMLRIVRLDLRSICWMEVKCFETLQYWNLPIGEIQAYGYSIAVYRETPGEGPRKEDGEGIALHDGTRVLLPSKGAFPDNSPAPETLTIQGIIFRELEDKTIIPVTIYLRSEELVPNY